MRYHNTISCGSEPHQSQTSDRTSDVKFVEIIFWRTNIDLKFECELMHDAIISLSFRYMSSIERFTKANTCHLHKDLQLVKEHFTDLNHGFR
jgi:hypothetical protein